jgi:hypothetical protein
MLSSQQGARQVFDNARRLVDAAGLSTQQTVLSQSYLRSEVLLSTTTTNYHVPILINDNQNGSTSSFNTSQLLNLQDAFVISGIMVGFSNNVDNTSTAFKVNTYPSAVNCGTSTTPSQAAATAMLTLYNAQLQLTVNNRQILTGFPILNCLYVPQTQGLDPQPTSETSFKNIDQTDAYYPAMVPIEPNIVLVGSKNNVCQIQLPAAISTLPTGGAPRLVVYFTGILAQNCTPVR